MQGRSVPESPDRHFRDSTKAVRATQENVAQVAQFLFLDREQTKAAHRALDGEPMRRVLGVLDWLLRHEQDEDYDPVRMLIGWARKRGAGEWKPTRGERVVLGEADPDPDREIERSLPRGKWGVSFTNEQIQANLDRMERGA